MQTTTNLQLKKIELSDSPPDITVLNANWDKLENELFPTIDVVTAPTGNQGFVKALLGGIANRIKAITGKANWWDAPATTIESLNTNSISKTLVTAVNDFIVGTGSSTVAKKTLAETKTILGINAASATATGVVELATAAEVTAGTDTTRAVTPAGLKVELDKKASVVDLNQLAAKYNRVMLANPGVATNIVSYIASLQLEEGFFIGDKSVLTNFSNIPTLAYGTNFMITVSGGILYAGNYYANVTLVSMTDSSDMFSCRIFNNTVVTNWIKVLDWEDYDNLNNWINNVDSRKFDRSGGYISGNTSVNRAAGTNTSWGSASYMAEVTGAGPTTELPRIAFHSNGAGVAKQVAGDHIRGGISVLTENGDGLTYFNCLEIRTQAINMNGITNMTGEADVAFRTGYSSNGYCKYYKDFLGQVHIFFEVKKTDNTAFPWANLEIADIPAGYRPKGVINVACAACAGALFFVTAYISPNGVLNIAPSASGATAIRGYVSYLQGN